MASSCIHARSARHLALGLFWGLLWGPGLALAAPPANDISREFHWVLGPQLQFVRPGVEGFPSLFAIGLEGGALWQLEHLQLRAQAHLLAAGGILSTTEGEGSASYTALGVVGDVGARVAVGGFAEDSSGYGFIYPAAFSFNAWIDTPEGKRRAHLNEVALQLGVGHVFHAALLPNMDVSATLFQLHVSPRTSETTLAFTPGLSMVLAL